jgi:hypothetical protein
MEKPGPKFLLKIQQVMKAFLVDSLEGVVIDVDEFDWGSQYNSE